MTDGPWIIEKQGHPLGREHDSSWSSNNSQSTSQQSAYSTSNQAAASQQASQSSSFSQTYIPEYSQTPILESIAKQAQALAPEVYQWGMQQYDNNQANIDAMMRNALTYASPQRQAVEMGKAEAGVQQGAEAGRQSAINDLQSFGIDPSAGRYAALDQASRVASGAAAAGAGNAQREATVAQGAQMAGQAQGLSEQNYQTGYGAGAGANALLNTASQLKYSPLGQMSGSQASSSASSTSSGGQTSYSQGSSLSRSTGGSGSSKYVAWAGGGSIPSPGIAPPASGEEPTQGGFVSSELSPSAGSQTDDVQARLNAGEFVIPKDVAAWKGQEFFYKLMAQARKMRAMASSDAGTPEAEQATGYAGGGIVAPGGGMGYGGYGNGGVGGGISGGYGGGDGGPTYMSGGDGGGSNSFEGGGNGKGGTYTGTPWLQGGGGGGGSSGGGGSGSIGGYIDQNLMSQGLGAAGLYQDASQLLPQQQQQDQFTGGYDYGQDYRIGAR